MSEFGFLTKLLINENRFFRSRWAWKNPPRENPWETQELVNPPRPLASRRVEAFTKFQTLQRLKQAHKGEGLPSPYPLPDGPAQRSVRFLNPLAATLPLQKVVVKPNDF